MPCLSSPSVSIIMGIYNCETTLQEALDSLYSQTFTDFEIILCDDSSSDNTFQLALANQLIHNNIVLIQNDKNLGLNATLNRCLELAKGNYIARMDADDISLPNRLEIEYQFLEHHPEYAIVSSPMIYFDEHGDFRMGKGNGEVSKYDFVLGTPFCHAPCMVRKEAYDKVHGYTVASKLLRVEDYHLWFKMYAVGYKGFNLVDPLYKMRDDRNAFSRRKFKYRINEAYVKHIGFKMLHLPFYYQFFALRPILVGLLPDFIYYKLHRK